MLITVSALCRSGNKNKQTRSGKDKSTGSYENWHRLQALRHERTMRKILPSSPAELITRDHCRPMRTLEELYISLTNALRIMKSEDLRDKSYVMSRGQSCQRQARGRRNGSKRTFRRYGTRKSGLPAHLTIAFWTNLYGASLSYRLMQSLTTKLRT